MNDYFHNLIKRNLGGPCPVRPRLPSLFEVPETQVPSGKETSPLKTPLGRDMQFSHPPAGDSRTPFFSGPAQADAEPVADKQEITANPARQNKIPASASTAPEVPIVAQPSPQALPGRNVRQNGAKPVPSTEVKRTQPEKEPLPRHVPAAEAPVRKAFSNKAKSSNLSARRVLAPRQTPITPLPDNQQPTQIAAAPGVENAAASERPESKTSEKNPVPETPGGIHRHFHPKPDGSRRQSSTGTSVPVTETPSIRPRPPEPDAPALPYPAYRFTSAGPEAEKTVHISIGRIEVQAVMPEPRPDKKPVRPRPGLSLEDYLKNQRGGKR